MWSLGSENIPAGLDKGNKVHEARKGRAGVKVKLEANAFPGEAGKRPAGSEGRGKPRSRSRASGCYLWKYILAQPG